MKMFFPLTAVLVAGAFIVSNANADNASARSTTVSGTSSSVSGNYGSRTGVTQSAINRNTGISTNRPADQQTPVARTNRTGSNPMNTNDRTTNTSTSRK